MSVDRGGRKSPVDGKTDAIDRLRTTGISRSVARTVISIWTGVVYLAFARLR